MGAKTWPCYNHNRVITSSIIKGLKCTKKAYCLPKRIILEPEE